MKLEVNVSKKHFFGVLGVLLILAGIAVVYAVAPNPGHDANNIGPGTFSGGPNSQWIFPGGVSANQFVSVGSGGSMVADVVVAADRLCFGSGQDPNCRTSWPNGINVQRFSVSDPTGDGVVATTDTQLPGNSKVCFMAEFHNGGCDSGAHCDVYTSGGTWRVSMNNLGQCDTAPRCSAVCY